MLTSLKSMMTRRPGSPQRYRYEEARRVLEEQNKSGKLELAASRDVQPEILYYLATDESCAVRQLVAANPATPHHADKLLARDVVEDVRSELARKIARLLPDSNDEERRVVRERAIEILETLAQDQAPAVRKIIAEELRASLHAPRRLIRKLAEDPEYPVCTPVLEYSPLLSDDDLKEIIAFTQVKGAIAAIARRASVSEEVADSIAASLDVPAVAALLVNPHANIREETLSLIVENAAEVVDWHAPLVGRPNLSVRLMRRLATFVASALVREMVSAHDMGAGDGEALLGRVRQRIQDEPVDAAETAKKVESVQDLFARGALTEKYIIEALDRNQRDIVLQALSLLSNIAADDVRTIIARKNPQRITALVWKAGLSMRTAFRIQAEVAMVPHRQLLFARDGVDYPLTQSQMQGLLDPFL